MSADIGISIYFAIGGFCWWLDTTGRMKEPAAYWALGSIAGIILMASI